MEKIIPIIILGPTASGKSKIGIKIAKALNGEIINADAMQIYKGFDVGTGKIREEEWEGITHHLISFLNPKETYSAGRYRIDCLKIIEEIKKRKKVPIIVGGTGFYIRALLKGIAPIPEVPKNLRNKLNKLISFYGCNYFYKFLSFLDPAYSKKVSKNDKQRIERALEVIFFSGKPFSNFFNNDFEKNDSFLNLKIGLYLEKEELKKRIIERVEKMIENGWLEEVKRLIDMQIPLSSQSFKSIGYIEMAEVLEGKLNLAQAKEIIIKKTVSYAKRQMVWFKKEKDVLWVKAKDLELAFFSILRYIKEKTEGEGYDK